MVFEVDNTTEQLIRKLQDGIEGTIDRLQTGQHEISGLIEEVKTAQQDFAQSGQVAFLTELLEEVCDDIRKKATAVQLQNAISQLEDLKKYAGTARNETGELLTGIRGAQSETIELLTGIKDTQNETRGLLTGIKDAQSEAAGLLSGIRDTQNETSELLSSIRENQSETGELLSDIKSTQDSTRELAEAVKYSQGEMGKQLAALGDAEGSILELVKEVNAAQERIAHTVEEAIDKVLRKRLEPIYELDAKIEALSARLLGQNDELIQTVQNAARIAQRNQISLKAIMNYLSLPGYKRFFKGMEVPPDAADEGIS